MISHPLSLRTINMGAKMASPMRCNSGVSLRVIDPRTPLIRAMLEIVFERGISIPGEIGESMRRIQAEFKQGVYGGSEGDPSKLLKCYDTLIRAMDMEAAYAGSNSSKNNQLDADQACDVLNDISIVVANLKVLTPNDLCVKAAFLRDALPRLPYDLQEGMFLEVLDDIETVYESENSCDLPR